MRWVSVALDVPLPEPFVYGCPVPVQVGQRVIVPFGARRKLIGMVVALLDDPGRPQAQIKQVDRVLDDLPPMPADWLRMAEFAARYYQRPLGQAMLSVLPASLRQPQAYLGARAGAGPVARHDAKHQIAGRKTGKGKITKGKATEAAAEAVQPESSLPDTLPALNSEQRAAVDAVAALQTFQPFLLHGITGSGKTEVYLGAMQAALARGQQI